MGHEVNPIPAFPALPINGNGQKGDPHKVTVEECRDMKNAGPITAEQYAQLTPDQQACYKPDGNGGYVVSDEVEEILAKPEHQDIQ